MFSNDLYIKCLTYIPLWEALGILFLCDFIYESFAARGSRLPTAHSGGGARIAIQPGLPYKTATTIQDPDDYTRPRRR